MWVEYYCISACQHTHCVAENCFTWVCTRCDRTDHAKWSHLGQSKSSVSGPCSCCDVFCSRCLVCYQVMLQDLISHITHTSFLNTHTCQYFRILFDLLADAGDDLFSLVHRHCLNYQLSLLGCFDSIIHILENAMFSGRSICDLHFCHNFLYNFLYHILTYWHEMSSLIFRQKIISGQAEP